MAVNSAAISGIPLATAHSVLKEEMAAPWDQRVAMNEKANKAEQEKQKVSEEGCTKEAEEDGDNASLDSLEEDDTSLLIAS